MGWLAAALLPPGRVEALQYSSKLLQGIAWNCGGRGGFFAYYESREGWWRLYTEKPSLTHASIHAFLAAGGCGVCSYSTYTLPSGSHAEIYVCTSKPLSRQALHTANPPLPQRSLARAVLEHYVARLLRDGASLWRLASLLAHRAGGGSALLAVLVNKPRRPPAPLYYLASTRPGVCVEYRRGSVYAYTSQGCRGGVVVHARPVAGLARVEEKTLEEAARG